MLSGRLDPFAVKLLYSIPAHLLLLKSRESNVDGLHFVTDGVPSLFDNLAPFLVAHQRKLTFDRGSRLTLVDSVRTDPLDLDSRLEVAFRKQLLLLKPEFTGLCLDGLVVLQVLCVEEACFFFESYPLRSSQTVPLLHDVRAVEGHIGCHNGDMRVV